MSVRGSLGRLAGRVVPGLDEYVYNRDRNRLYPQTKQCLSSREVPAFLEREPHIVVAALEGPGCSSWGPAQGNYYYEVFQSAREHFGEDAVSVLDVGAEGSEHWGDQLADLLRESQATHLIAHMERDPGLFDNWTWDVVWSQVARWWDGVFVGVMWDSGFDLIQRKGRRLARISPNLLGLDICVPVDQRLVGRREVGPVPLLESLETQGLLEKRLVSVEKTSDVSFIGAVYPYREELLAHLEAVGLRVTVNPHRSPGGERASWLDYMAALAASETTLNFSLASSGRDEQLKWRVIEATLAGTLLLTDDRTRTSEYLTLGTEFDIFSSAQDLPGIVAGWLDQPTKLHAAQREAQKRAKVLATHEFWLAIQRALIARDLPLLPDLGQTPKP